MSGWRILACGDALVRAIRCSTDLSPFLLICFLTNRTVSTTLPGPDVSAVRAVTMETPSQAEPRPVNAAPVPERPPATSEFSSYSQSLKDQPKPTLMMRRRRRRGGGDW